MRAKKKWNKTRYLIRSITKNLDGDDKKYMKIKFVSDDDSPLDKRIKVRSMIVVVRVCFMKITNIILTFS